MSTNIVDTQVHGASLPANYTGAGTIAASCKNAGGVINQAAGFYTSNGNATQINCGFQPLKVKVVNVTDGITWEWLYGMPAADSIKTTLGGSLASVMDTASQLLLSGSGGKYNVTLGATLNGTSKAIVFSIEG